MILCADGLAFSGLLSGLVAGCLEGLRQPVACSPKIVPV